MAGKTCLLSHEHPRALAEDVGQFSEIAVGDDQARAWDRVVGERREIARAIPAASSCGVTPPKVDPPVY